MDDRDVSGYGVYLFAICAVLAGFVAGGCVGQFIGIDKMQRAAVVHGHAEYVAGSDGASEWRWKAVESEQK